MYRTNALRRYNLSFYCAHPFLMERKIRLVSPKRALWLGRGVGREGGGGKTGGKVGKANGNEWVGLLAFPEATGNIKMPQKHLIL